MCVGGRERGTEETMGEGEQCSREHTRKEREGEKWVGGQERKLAQGKDKQSEGI